MNALCGGMHTLNSSRAIKKARFACARDAYSLSARHASQRASGGVAGSAMTGRDLSCRSPQLPFNEIIALASRISMLRMGKKAAASVLIASSNLRFQLKSLRVSE